MIEDIKDMIRDKGAIEGMRLIFAGKELEDGNLLTVYRIKKDSTIRIALRLRG